MVTRRDISPFLCGDQAKPDPITSLISPRHCLLDKTRFTQWTITTLLSTPNVNPTSESIPRCAVLLSPGAHSAPPQRAHPGAARRVRRGKVLLDIYYTPLTTIQLITRKPAPSLEDQFSWVFHHLPASAASGSGSGRELTPPLVTRKRKYSDMATQDELNSHAASRKRLASQHSRSKRYAVPPRIRKGNPRIDTDALHSTRGRLWKKQGDRIPLQSLSPNKHALQLRRVHHYTSALLDFAMSFKRSRHVNTSWHSIRGLYQCLMDHVHPVAEKFPSPRMKAWVSYLYVLSYLLPSFMSTNRLRSKRSLQEHDGPQHRKG